MHAIPPTAPEAPLPTLPLHLTMAMGCWLSSPFALKCANAAWESLSALAPPKSPPAALQQAIEKEAKSRVSELLTGVLKYVEKPYKRDMRERPVIWRKGNARILDYGMGSEGAHTVALFVPSLINRYYILDLEEERSMLRFMAASRVYPLVLDWGAPGEFEKSFGCGDYITDILLPAIDEIHRMAGKKISLIGYCMGGVMTIAAAQLAAQKVDKLALLATPWDFHCKAFKPFIVDEEWRPTMKSLLASQKMLPAEVIQSMFYMTDPWVFEQKFRRFARLQAGSPAEGEFVALEHWVNDGVPMTANVARECLIDWAQENHLADGSWQVAGKTIDPKKLRMPTFVAIPKSDHVVPFDCAMPLVESLKKPVMIEPSAGHVGMIVGGKAKKELWSPLSEWLLNPVR